MGAMDESYGYVQDIIKGLLPMVKAVKKGSVSNIAQEIMVLPEGTKLNLDITPYMREPLNLTTSREYESIIFVSGARTGKSINLVDGFIAYVISTSPSDLLLIFATEAMARRYARMRFNRLVKNSPKLLKLLSTDHREDNILNKSFTNGMSVWMGSPTPSNLSASDYRYTIWSDVDRGLSSNSDGDIFTQLRKRGQTFGSSSICIAESSPSRDLLDGNWVKKSKHEAPPVEGILSLYNKGDRRMLYWSCPHCSELIHMTCDLELFNLPNNKIILDEIENENTTVENLAKKYAFIYCPSCGSQIIHDYKTQLNKNAIWIKEDEKKHNKQASYWLSGLCAKFQSWESILQNYFNALIEYSDTGNEEKLKAVFNVDLGSSYTSINITDGLNYKDLEARAIKVNQGIVPEEARFIIASVDVQKRKYVVQVQAYGVNFTSWIIDRFDITMSNRNYGGVQQGIEPATYSEDWEVLLDQVIMKRYKLKNDSRTMGILLTLCDSGGAASATRDSSTTEQAYLFWKKCKLMGLENKFQLIKGLPLTANSTSPAIKRSLLTKQSRTAAKTRVVGQLPLWLLNTTLLKDTITARLKRTKGDGVINFPTFLNSTFYKEITAEVRTEKGWQNLKGRRNESFDLLVYCHAGLLILMDRYFRSEIDWENPPSWCAEWDYNSEVLESEIFEKPKKEKKPTLDIYHRGGESKQLGGFR